MQHLGKVVSQVIMNKEYTQLTLQEREKIFVLRARGKTAAEIAEVLGAKAPAVGPYGRNVVMTKNKGH